MSKYFSIVLVVFLLSHSKAFEGQSEARFERLTRTEGLSHNNVYSILQDRFGFLWVGTQDGLNRYDGFTFKHFYNEPSIPNSLISNNIAAIYQSKDGCLWFGTFSYGLNRYDPLKNEFRHFIYDENDSQSISSNHISYICEDHKGNLWIATSGGGINYFNIDKEEFTKYQHSNRNSNSLSSNDVNEIEVDNNGNLWIGTSTNLDYYDIKRNSFSHFVLGYESFDQSKKLSVKTLHLDKNKLLWIGTSNGLYTFNTEKKIFSQFKHNITDKNSISDENINTIFEDSFGNIWIGTEQGLNLYLPEINGFTTYNVDVFNPNSLNSNRILRIYEDRSNLLWIGTKGGGLNKLDLKRKSFYSIRYNPNIKSGLSHPSVTAIIGDTSGYVWIGTDGGGICYFNRNDNNIKCLKQKLNKKEFLSDDQILSATFIKNKLVLGMQTGGLNLIELHEGEYKLKKYHKTNDSSGIANNQVNCLLNDKDGFLWIGTRDGLDKLIDTVIDAPAYFISYKKNYNSKNCISGNNITALYQDHQGYIWIGTYSTGLNRLNLKTGKIDQFTNEVNNSATLGSNSINCIFEDHLGFLWIGTAGGGLSVFNSENQSFKTYSMKDGLASNEVMAILEDHSGFLWISTSKGLSKFDLISKKFTNFDIMDGLLSDGFNPSAAYQDVLGWMYFGTNSGLIYFNPGQIKLNPHKPEIIITGFSLMQQNEWLSNELFISKYNAEESKIVLDYDKNIFSLDFAAMDFTNPVENQFQYKIDGINNKWINYGNKRYIMVTNLEPGEYKLRIRGTNNDGIYNEEGIALSIKVKPPFWKSDIFYLVLGVIFTLIAISIYSFLIKLRTNKILALKNHELKQANQLLIDSEKSLKELNNTKDKFFSIIAHDLRNPFNPLLSLTELLDDDYNKLEEKERIGFIKEIRHGAKKLYDLLENLLNWALSQTKQIKFNPIELDINEVIQNNIELLKINAEKKEISIIHKFDGAVYVLADENMLNSTIRNLLNNAIKFSTDKSKIIIHTVDSDEFCTIEVKDFGSGIHVENLKNIFSGFSDSSINNAKGKGSGLGLILCKEFVEKNGGKIWAESQLGEGSSFFFTVVKAGN